jgi:hypothetical protein
MDSAQRALIYFLEEVRRIMLLNKMSNITIPHSRKCCVNQEPPPPAILGDLCGKNRSIKSKVHAVNNTWTGYVGTTASSPVPSPSQQLPGVLLSEAKRMGLQANQVPPLLVQKLRMHAAMLPLLHTASQPSASRQYTFLCLVLTVWSWGKVSMHSNSNILGLQFCL